MTATALVIGTAAASTRRGGMDAKEAAMNFGDAVKAWADQTTDGDEVSFRRGYVHGIAFAIDAVAAGATVDQLNDWLNRCQAWREGLSRGEQSEWIAPRFKEATDGTRKGT